MLNSYKLCPNACYFNSLEEIKPIDNYIQYIYIVHRLAFITYTFFKKKFIILK